MWSRKLESIERSQRVIRLSALHARKLTSMSNAVLTLRQIHSPASLFQMTLILLRGREFLNPGSAPIASSFLARGRRRLQAAKDTGEKRPRSGEAYRAATRAATRARVAIKDVVSNPRKVTRGAHGGLIQTQKGLAGTCGFGRLEVEA
jgi:hypothetical protein